MRTRTIGLVMGILAAGTLPAVELGSPFTDGAVLQRGTKVPVWGWASPGERVTVTFAGQKKSAKADAKGKWRVALDPLEASKEGRVLRANGAAAKDVLVGEVWFFSGQSNCGLPLCGDNPHYRERNGALRAQITNRPHVRLATWGKHTMALEPQERTPVPVRWYALTPRNLMKRDPWATSAIAFQFALELDAALDVPIGVLQHFWGGVGIDSWIPREGYAKHPELAYEMNLKRYPKDAYKPELFEREHFKWGYQQQPTVLWNAFVAPVAPYALRGLVWHQGCNNAGPGESSRYAWKLHALYDGWSMKFGNPDFRLYFAQLADYQDAGEVELRLQQAKFEKEEPHAAMAVTSDTGVFRDIHSPDKAIVGTRLALKALKRDYGFDIEDSSPEVRSWTVETNTVRLVFDHAKELYFYNGDWSLENLFDLKGEDGAWHPATIVNFRPEDARQQARGRLAGGRLTGEGLVLSAKGVTAPQGVRYLFRPPYRSNVYNEVNLPLGPFVRERKSASALTTEYRENPVGIDRPAPRLSWKLPAGMARQTAYELELDGVAQGRVDSGETLNRPWTGGKLETGSRHTWRVRVWDEGGEPSDWSSAASFSMGVMSPSDWRAKWIGPNAATRPDVDFGAARWVTSTGGVLRAVFTLSEIPETKEIVFLSRAPYSLKVNGKASRGSYEGHDWTPRFAKFHDLANDELKVGENVIEFGLKRPTEWSAGGDALALVGVMREKGRTVGEIPWVGAQRLGGLREVAWATNLVLRDELASPAFEKRFTVGKDVARATLFITGLGLYEASLNGRRIGDKVLDPSHTDYTKRVLYSTYRLDGQVKRGENVLKVLVGHGFYDVRLKSVWDNDMATWRDVPRMIAQLELAYADGTRETVVSDESWRQVKSPVGWDDIREGEVVGGRHVCEPEFPKGGFPVAVMDAPAGALEAENHAPSRILYENRPTRIKPVAGETGAYMVAFPENVAGWVRLKMRGQSAGDVVSVRYDEHKDGDLEPAAPDSYYRRRGISVLGACGRVDGPVPRMIDCHFKSTMSCNVCPTDRGFQTDRFISSGAAAETYEPRFTYNGFQYVLVRGLRRPLEEDDIVQCVVSTDFRSVAEFNSSDPRLDRLVRAAARTYRANFTMGFPTDCPHREKNGWTGDASVASDFAQFQFENTATYEKWLTDIVDSQRPSGEIPGIVPSPRWGYLWGNGPAWDSALPVVAWNLYRYRDDRRAVEIAYPALVRNLAFAETKADADGIVKHGLGDWIPPDWKRIPSVAFTSSCFILQANRLAAKMATVLGKTDEAARYDARASELRRAIRRRFLKADGVFDNGGQTAQSAAFQFGLVEPDEEKSVGERLLEAVHRRDDHLETGVIGCKTLFRALSRIGRDELALKLILRPDAPSYGAWLAKGGDTFWEDWGEGASRNHIMFGDVACWAYEHILGLRLAEDANAFRHFAVRPAWRCGLDHASGRVETPYGRVEIAWRKGAGLDVTVPPGTTCDALSEKGRTVRLSPGRHHVGE